MPAGDEYDSVQDRSDVLAPVRTAVEQLPLRGTDVLALDPFGGAAVPAPVQRSAPHALKHAWRYKWLALVVFVAVAAPGAIGVYSFYKPQFVASATIEVAPLIPRLVYRTDDNGMIPLYQHHLNTQVGIIQSPQVLHRVLDLPEVRETDWFRNPVQSLWGGTESSLERLRSMLEIVPRGGTYVIEVKATTRVADDAAILANAVVDKYLELNREQSKQADEDKLQHLNDQYRELRTEIERMEAAVAALRGELGTGDPKELLSQRRTQLETMKAEAEILRRNIEITQFRFERLATAADAASDAKAADADGATDGSDDQDWKYASDVEWRRLYLELENSRHRLDVEGARLGDAHPTMVELQKRVAMGERLLKAREFELDHTWAGAAPAGAAPGTTSLSPAAERATLEQTLAVLRFEERLRLSAIKTREDEVARTNEVVQLLDTENDALRHKRELYELVRAKKTEGEVESHAPGSIRVQSQAVPPGAPSNNKRRLMMMAMAVAAGAFLGVGAAYVRATTNRAVLDATDVTEPARTAFLGHLPMLRNPDRPTHFEEHVLEERIRVVRTALLERLDPRRGQTVVVTSAGPRVGKTTLTFQLGSSLAQCGQRVLLIDGDLRNSALSRRSGAENRRGLIDLVAHGAKESDVIVATDQPGLQILPAGRLPDRDLVEVLADPKFRERLRAWREQFNVILIDSPPILPVADAAILARIADGTVITAREGHCRRPDVVAAITRLSTCGAKLLGVVYIGSCDTGQSYYYDAHYRLPARTRRPARSRDERGVSA